jgi:hypothetical protein
MNMRYNLINSILIIYVLSGISLLSGCSKDEKNSNATMTHSEADRLVRDLEKKEIEAILSKDLETLQKIWDTDFTVNSPLLHQLVGREQVLKMTQNDIISYEKFERNIEKTTFMGNVLVTMGEEILIPKNNNPNAGQTIKRRFTNVWQYKNGNWVETNRHAHIVPQQ